MDDKKIVIITGRITSGKTTFLTSLLPEMMKHWKVAGFCSKSSERQHRSGQVARDYHIKLIGEEELLPWAVRNAENIGFDFVENTKEVVEQKLLQQMNQADFMVIDDIGFLEIMGKGFDHLVKEIAARKNLVISVKKEILDAFIKRYQLESYLVVDLDSMTYSRARKKVFNFLKSYDGEKIAVFASINGVTEVGLGSLLHSLRVPFKGHFLALLQNFLLILFGKELRGRNLFWVVLISSGLKSFSPAGARLMPMFYIFVQGLAFILPVWILGWHLLAVFLGSLLMGQITLVLSLGLDYVRYGRAIFDAYIGGINKLLGMMGIEAQSLLTVIIILVVIKALLSLIVFAAGQFFDFSRLLTKLQRRVERLGKGPVEYHQRPDLKNSFTGSLGDLINWRFILSFVFMGLLIYFFAGLSTVNFVGVMIRALVLSWFGFLISRRINFEKLVDFLNRHDLSYVATGLKQALAVVESFRRKRKKRVI